MYSSSTPSLSITESSSDHEDGGFYGRKTQKKAKGRKAKQTFQSDPDKRVTTIDEPEFYPIPRSMKSENSSHQNRKCQTAYIVPSPLDYNVYTKLTHPRAPRVTFDNANERDGALWPSYHCSKSEIRPKWSPNSVYNRAGYRDTRYDRTSTSRRSPAYSFGLKHSDIEDKQGPGPVAYFPTNVYRTGMERGLSFSLSSRRRDLTSY